METLKLLKLKADKAGRNLKTFMEFVLHREAYAFEPSEEYKTMMDKMIDNHEKGKTKYTSWDAIKKQMFK